MKLAAANPGLTPVAALLVAVRVGIPSARNPVTPASLRQL
jgi:hypothetical protein